MKTSALVRSAFLGGAAVLCGTGMAWAQQSGIGSAQYPYYLGASERVTHDSYMQRYGGNGQDWFSNTGLRAGVNQTFGRQRLVADVSMDRNLYKRNGFLNHNAHSVQAALNWSTLERLSGLLSAQSSEALYRNTLTTQADGRYLLRNEGVTLRAQLGTVTVWSFDAGYSVSRQRINGTQSTALNNLNTDQNTVDGGVRWAPTPDLSVRLGGRHGRGKLPAQNDEFTRNDIDLTTSAALTGASNIFTRLSSTRLKHSAAGFGNTRGWTGLLGYNWTPTGKLRLSLTGSRDSSLGSIDQVGQLINSTNGSSSNTLAVGANWEITSQLLLDSRLSYIKRKLDQTTGTSSNTGKDSVSSLTMGLRYLPLRNLDLGCGFAIEDHAVQQQVVGYIGPYNARSFYCSAQAFLR